VNLHIFFYTRGFWHFSKNAAKLREIIEKGKAEFSRVIMIFTDIDKRN
jgi:uncharacterized membrane protein YwzB